MAGAQVPQGAYPHAPRFPLANNISAKWLTPTPGGTTSDALFQRGVDKWPIGVREKRGNGGEKGWSSNHRKGRWVILMLYTLV